MKHSQATIRDVLRIFWKASSKYPFLIVGMLVSVTIAVVLSAIYPLYYKQFFDILSRAQATVEVRDQLLGIIWFIFFLHMLEFVGYRSASFLDSIYTAGVMADLRNYAFAKVNKQSYGFFVNSFTGAIVQKINRLSTSFQKFFDRFYWHLVAPTIRLVAITFILAFHSTQLMFVMLTFIFLVLIVNIFFARWKIRFDILRAREETHTTAVLADAITNNDAIRLFFGYDYEVKRFWQAVERLRKASLKTWIWSGFNESAQALVFIGTMFAVFFMGVHLWFQGIATLGVIVLVFTYYLQIQRQIWEMPRTIRDVFESIADAKEMVEIIKRIPDIQDASNALPLRISHGAINFKNLTFSYSEAKPVFNELTLLIKGGERVAFVGPSGAGKSTLIRLILRFHDVIKGAITIDGYDIRSVTQETLRKSISFVPQEPILFHRSILENIRYGRLDATDEQVYEASRLAHCEEFITGLPKGYATLVGERGVKLSGGEKQRIAIARVILKNAPILILDEATSSLDSESERYIQDALKNLMKGKTTIAIAHRLSTIRKMDRIIVLENGRIAEEGSHDMLLQKDSSLYARLWALQSGGFLKDENV